MLTTEVSAKHPAFQFSKPATEQYLFNTGCYDKIPSERGVPSGKRAYRQLQPRPLVTKTRYRMQPRQLYSEAIFQESPKRPCPKPPSPISAIQVVREACCAGAGYYSFWQPSAVAGPMAAEKGKPLAVKDVMELLKGSVPSSEIARVVEENGISFRMFDELENQFREAGATDELIDALKKASKPEATTPPAPATGMLKIQSQPGEAQVYVNDEPKGMTSSGGELRLSGYGSRHLSPARGSGGL